jgi:triosephosphate isomerase
LYLIPLKEVLRKEIQIAAQNCYFKDSGAFTGEIRFISVLCSSRIGVN